MQLLGTVLPNDGTYLDLKLGIKLGTAQFLRFLMFWVIPPCAYAFLRLEFNDRYPHSILRAECLETYKTGHALGERSHACCHLLVRGYVLRVETRTTYRNNHELTPATAERGAIQQRLFSHRGAMDVYLHS